LRLIETVWKPHLANQFGHGVDEEVGGQVDEEDWVEDAAGINFVNQSYDKSHKFAQSGHPGQNADSSSCHQRFG
jgi:hypothetical protein